MTFPDCRQLLLLLFLISYGVHSQPITPQQAWVHETAESRSFSTACQPGAPRCLALVGIFSHAYFTERRMRIRHTWLRHATPGVDFAFILGLPDVDPNIWSEANRLVEQYVRWEWLTYHDLVILNVSEQDSHASDAAKGHAWFSWASHTTHTSAGQPRYQYFVKLDDDNVLNPYQLRLAMTMFPRRDRVFWGRPLLKRGWPTAIHIGPLYLVSYDLAEQLAKTSHTQFLLDSDLPVGQILEDLRMSSYLRRLVPREEWLDALPCMIHNHPDPQAPMELMYPYSNQSIVVHDVKEQYFFVEAFAALLPYIEAMAADCAEWVTLIGQGGDTGAPERHLQPPSEARCRRWHHTDSCFEAAGPYVAPDPDAKYRHVHRTAGAMMVFMVTFTVVGIIGAVMLERYGGCSRLCR